MTSKNDPQETTALVPRRANPYQLNVNLEPVDLARVREQLDPKGPKVEAKDLVGHTFTIVEFRPQESTFEGAETYYWVKAIHADTGEMFHTVLGGRAVVEDLDTMDSLRASYVEAARMGDEARAADLVAAGAGRPFTVTLDFIEQGKYNGYYVFV